jgi:peptidoglycan/LPS O-acetylase OafA/YrhL
LAIFLLGYLYLLPYLLTASGVNPTSLPNFGDLSHARAVQWTMWSFTSNFLMVAGERMGAALEPLLTLGLGAQLTILIAFLLPLPRRVYLGTGVVVFLGFVLRLYWVKSDAYVPYSFPLTRGDGFFLGATFALLLRWEAARARLLALRGRLLLVSTILLVALGVATKGLQLTSPAMKILGYPAVSLWSATLVLWLSQISRCPSALRLLSLLGQGAYCAYLVKLPVCYLVSVFLLRVRMPGIPLFALSSLCATALLGMAGHFLFERPFARIGALSRSARRAP